MNQAASLCLASSGRLAALLGVAACVIVAGCDRGAPKSESPSSPSSPAGATAGGASPTAPAGPAIPIATPIQKETGYAWFVKTDVNPAERKLRVFEGAKELGPGDSLHEDVRKKGLGAYSHWNAEGQGFLVYFSTSDNSDPNTNGRTYTLR